jgi:hypothetical protein
VERANESMGGCAESLQDFLSGNVSGAAECDVAIKRSDYAQFVLTNQRRGSFSPPNKPPRLDLERDFLFIVI